jgi:hypothetical protein
MDCTLNSQCVNAGQYNEIKEIKRDDCMGFPFLMIATIGQNLQYMQTHGMFAQ